jgi:hypothetical protein
MVESFLKEEVSNLDDDFSVRLIGFQKTMGVLNVIEAKNFDGPGTVKAFRGVGNDLLEWNGGEGIIVVTEDECAGEEGEVHAGGQAGDDIERDGLVAAKETGDNDASPFPDDFQGVERGAIADEVENTINAVRVRLADGGSEVVVFDMDRASAEGFKKGRARLVASRGQHGGTGADGEIDGGLAKGGSAAADEELVAGFEFVAIEEATPGGDIGLGNGGEVSPG